jgi:hypothetical protein
MHLTPAVKSTLLYLQGRSKQVAKQLAAAALLELMLYHVPFQEFVVQV